MEGKQFLKTCYSGENWNCSGLHLLLW